MSNLQKRCYVQIKMDKLFNIPYENFRKVTDEIISNLYNDEKHTKNTLSEGDIKEIKKEVNNLTLEVNFEFEALKTILESKQYNENKIMYFITSLKEKKSELLISTLAHINASNGETVGDFDWALKLILGTSELKTVKYPLLQLLLTTVTKSGQHNIKVYDLKKDMLDKMIDVLDSIKY